MKIKAAILTTIGLLLTVTLGAWLFGMFMYLFFNYFDYIFWFFVATITITITVKGWCGIYSEVIKYLEERESKEEI